MNDIDDYLDEAPFYIEQVGIRQVKEKVYYSKTSIDTPKAAVDILAEEIRYYDREVVGIVNVDSKLTPLNVSICSIGTINKSLVNPREMLKASILSNASGVVMIHLCEASHKCIYAELLFMKRHFDHPPKIHIFFAAT